MSASRAAGLHRVLTHPGSRLAVFALCLLPLGLALVGVWQNTLGANPAETLIRGAGEWTLRFLCLTLAITPLRLWTGQPAWLRYRRMLGLFSFFYGCLHFVGYALLDMSLDWHAMIADVAQRPFVLVGAAALALMLPLAGTSFARAVRALGAARWRRLHRLVYGVALLALLHFFWIRSGKNDFAEVAVYAAVVAVLLGERVRRWLMAPRPQAAHRTR